MSYDLMVFDPKIAPREREAFLAWYAAQTQWTEPHDYRDPLVTCPALLAWYSQMRGEFPNLYEQADGDGDLHATEYSIGYSAIYASFRWPVAESAYTATRTAAERHGVGFFDASSDAAEIWFPPAK